ncbi:MAG: PH domain-containing protein [Flavobacterium sp.]|nr:PH domain-containing protein [Flavobacterium sp.]
MHVFPSSKSRFTTILLWALALLLPMPLVFTVGEADLQTEIFVGFIFFGFSGLILWMLYGTNYRIIDNLLYFSNGPIKGKIKITSIKRVEYDKKIIKTSFYRPALDSDGLTIYYDKYEDIFVSPQDKEGFIAALKTVNPEIEVK